jgi:hypothetical protein
MTLSACERGSGRGAIGAAVGAGVGVGENTGVGRGVGENTGVGRGVGTEVLALPGTGLAVLGAMLEQASNRIPPTTASITERFIVFLALGVVLAVIVPVRD